MDNLDSVKILVVGDKSVGKTSLVQRFVTGRFPLTTKSSVSVNYFYRRMDTADEKEVLVNVYDAPSSPESRQLTSFYYQSVQGIMIVYDVNDLTSIAGLSTWIKEISEKILADTVVLLVGSKADVNDKSDLGVMAAKKTAAQNGLDVIDVSCVTGDNVDVAFKLLIDKIAERKRELRENRATPGDDIVSTSTHPVSGRGFLNVVKKFLRFLALR